MSQGRFIHSSLFLFLDFIVVAISSWLYWLVISKLISISEVGQSTTVYSLVFLTSTLIGLGLEYPLLKNVISHRSKMLGSALFVEFIATMAAIPFVVYALNELQQESLRSYSIVAIGMLISVSLGFVARYALLGISDSRTVLVIDTISSVAKFACGYFLVLLGFGALGILISFMVQALIVACIGLYLTIKKLGFSIGDLNYIKDTVRNGVVNMPSIFSRTLIVSLSVVLLASFGITSSEVGIFYISLMVSIVAGSVISSTSYMVIPSSSMAKTDMSAGSMRIGISLTAPIIAVLLVSPKSVLSFIGTQYVSGEMLLLILTVGILPFAIVTNTISRLNYLGKPRKLLFMGLLQLGTFLLAFMFLVPQFKATGAALSILVSYSVSCIPALVWSEKILLRYVVNTVIAIAGGWGISNMFRLLLPDGNINDFTTALVSIVVTLTILFALKNTSFSEVRTILNTIVKSTS
jgi:O-antigen/teichoic acid export membrane protein